MLQGKSRYNESYENENTADHTAWACDVVNSGEEQLGTTKARAAPSFPPDHPLGRAATSDSDFRCPSLPCGLPGPHKSGLHLSLTVSLPPKHQQSRCSLHCLPARIKDRPRCEAQGTASATEPAGFGQTRARGPSWETGCGVHLVTEWGQNAPRTLNPVLVLPKES